MSYVLHRRSGRRVESRRACLTNRDGLVMVALLLAACDGGERSARADALSSPGSSPVRDTATAAKPVRVDTLRDSTGAHFSPSQTTVALTRAGGVVALDTDDKRVVVFDSTGVQRHASGRVGSGPGEFRYLRGVFALPDDSIAVWDPMLRRMSYFDGALKFDRTEAFPKWEFSSVFAELVGRFSDGRWVAKMSNDRIAPDAKSGAEAVVDSIKLVVGRSADSPSEFLRLPLRAGVDVVSASKSMSTVHLLRLSELDVGVGAICDSGAMLVDSGGVRVVYANANAPRAWPLPRAGFPFKTNRERDDVVRLATSSVDSFASAKKARAVLSALVQNYTVRMRRPTIDAQGELWYDDEAAPYTANGFVERVDSAGRMLAFVRLSTSVGVSQFGSNTVASLDYGSDTTGITIRLAHFAPSLASETPKKLGHCFRPFRY